MKKRYFILVAAGFCAGIINGLFGTGGGLILVPFMKNVVKLEQKKAQATAISVILFLSIISLTIYITRFKGLAELSLPYIVGGALGAPLGAFLLKKIPNKLLKRIFALFLIYSGIRMMFFK